MSFLQGKTGKYCVASLVLAIFCPPVSASSDGAQNHSNMTSYLKSGNVVLQLGAFQGVQGRSQHIDIPGAIGDDFSVNSRTDYNALVGIGYFLPWKTQPAYQLSYGLNLFYLPEMEVKGDVAQESTFTNMSYQYKISHLPLFFDVRGLLHTSSSNYDILLDAGVGPNFMFLKHFRETALNASTVPDDPFSNTTDVRVSATIGVNVRINNLAKDHPVDCGYRFFYLGKGEFNHSVQVSDSLDTGHTFANALMCSITL